MTKAARPQSSPAKKNAGKKVVPPTAAKKPGPASAMRKSVANPGKTARKAENDKPLTGTKVPVKAGDTVPVAGAKGVAIPTLKRAGKQELTAKVFIDTLMTYQSNAELKKYERYFSFNDEKPLVGDQFVGVRMGHVFDVAKLFLDMPVQEIEKLMEHGVHEVRAGAMSIMGKAASVKKVSAERLRELYELYLRRHDRINSWDLVDLAAHQVVGRYLYDKPRKVLYQLAKSKNPYERRTAILSTAHFIRQGEVEETFKIAALLMKDKDETVNKATGWMLRYAGKDRKQLKAFLDQYAATMPRSALRNALEHFDSKEKAHYMGLKKV